ncbi:MAG: PQQ-binding-like beta-propeller repeat protein [Limisphaerales bacterium]
MNRILASLLLTALTATAADWPQWRGPNRDGISKETGLLKSWPEGGPKLAWKATGMGDAYTSPSVVGGQIFGMGLFDQDESVWALDTATGKLLWKTRIGDAARVRQTQGGHGPRSTPTVAGTLLYVEGAGGTIACLEASNGKVVWTKSLVSDFGGAAPSWGFSESPLVDGERVLVTPGGQGGAIVALNKKTGDTVWATKDFKDRAEYSCLVAAEIGGVKQYVQLTGQNVAGIAPDSGKVLWTAVRQGKTATIPTPIVSGDLVYVTSGYGIGCNLFKVSKDSGGFKAEQVYANTQMVNHHGGVIQIGGFVYGSSDVGKEKPFTCMDLKTGEVKWTEASVAKGSLTSVDGLLIHRAEGNRGTVTLFEPIPAGFKQHGRFDQPDRSGKPAWAHPVVANGKLYLRDMDVLLAYDVKAK